MRRALSIFLCVAVTAGGQSIVHDGTLGTAGSVTPSGRRYNILSRNGSRVGNNLFHSFSEFSVPDRTTASFGTDLGTANVIARVTGGNASQINGTLTIGRQGVSLYLLNPSGILFGKDAALDIRGSFHAVAGDSISFTDGQTFQADPSAPVTLTSAPVASFGFLNRSAPAPIAVSSFLDSRSDISLVGRTVTLDEADLYAEGSIRIAAVGSGARTVTVNSPPQGQETSTGHLEILSSNIFTGGVDTEISLRGGDMEIRSSILNFGSLDSAQPADLALSSSGSVQITDGSFLGSISGETKPTAGINLTVAGQLSILDSAVQSFTIGSAPAGDVAISASSLEISGNGGVKVLGIGSTSFSIGRGGNIAISVPGNISIENAGTISAIASDAGSAGEINISTSSIKITGLPTDTAANNDFLTGIVAVNFLAGNGGDIAVIARDSIELRSGGLIDSSSFGSGHGGNIQVESTHIFVDRAGSDFFTGIGSDAGDTGSAGTIRVTTDTLELRNGGLVSAATFDSGAAGDVTVTARDIVISGTGSVSPFVVSPTSAIVASTGVNSTGNGGNVNVMADGGTLIIQNGGQIGAEALGSGRAGTVEVKAEDTRILRGGRISSSATGGGNAGGVALGGGELFVSQGEIGVRSSFSDAGSLFIDMLGDISLENSVITAASGNDGGNIDIRGGGSILASDSEITADARGNGGNIGFADARHLVLNRTPVSASAVDRDGGSITISTGTFLANLSPLSVTSKKGAPGTVSINTLDSLSGGEENEDPELLDPADILEPDCNLRRPEIGSSFTKAGRGGTERLPGGFLPSFRIIE